MTWKNPLKGIVVANRKHILILGVPLIAIATLVVIIPTIMYFYPGEDIMLWVLRTILMASIGVMFVGLVVRFGVKKWINK